MITVRKLAIGVGALSALASAAHAQNSASATASGSATVIQPIAAESTANLGFGTIVKPTTGTATVSVSPTGSRTVTGTAAANAAGVSNAAFNVIGEGGATYSVSVPANFNMTSGTDTLTVTTSNNAGGGGQLTGAIGSTSTASFGVGGAINVTTGTASGAYTGNVTVTASYN